MQAAIAKIMELQNATGANQKQAVLSRYKNDKDFCNLLYYALNPMLTYKVSEQTLRVSWMNTLDREESAPPFEPWMSDIFKVCEHLSGLSALDNKTLFRLRWFVHIMSQPKEGEFYIKLLSKMLRLGVTAKTVNKVIPGLIPEWEVQQAYPIEKHPLKPGVWFTLTQKLNGVRATFYKGRLYARSGIPYEGLQHITNVLSCVDSFRGLVFDGELTLHDKGDLSDNEAFRKATGIINSDDQDKTVICYTIFDVINTPEFESDKCVMTYKARRTALEAVGGLLPSDCHIRVLPPLYMGTDQNMIGVLLDQMVAEDKEGLIVNLDVPYKRKRHSGILKVKQFYTMDLPIIECEEGSGRLAGTLGAFVLDYKGNSVRVGSGFSDEQRAEFWSHRDDLSGVLCEVKYKEISSDKNTGAESLQFPIFVSLRTDKTEISYG